MDYIKDKKLIQIIKTKYPNEYDYYLAAKQAEKYNL